MKELKKILAEEGLVISTDGENWFLLEKENILVNDKNWDQFIAKCYNYGETTILEKVS